MTVHGLRTWGFVVGFFLICGCASRNTEPVAMVSEDVFQVPGTEQMWRVQKSARIFDLEGVEQYLGTLNSGEYSDWRLPDKHELGNLFAAVDLQGKGDLDIRLEGFYWLAGEYGGPPYVGAWKSGDQ